MLARTTVTCLASILFILALVPIPINATVHHITDDGLGDYATIQDAVDASIAGDTILLADGTFTGTGNWDIDFGGKDLVVRSQNGPAACFIDCLAGASGEHRAFYFHTSETAAAVVDGIGILNGLVVDTHGAGIYIFGASPTIRNCHISQCVADQSLVINFGYGGGICVQNGSPVIANTTISDNTAADRGGAIYFSGSGTPMVSGCVLTGNTATEGSGIFLSSADIDIVDCLLENNGDLGTTGTVMVSLDPASGATSITNCQFVSNSASLASGIAAISSSPEVLNCTFFDNEGWVYSGSGGTITNCIFSDGGMEIDATSANVTYCWVEGGYSGTGNINGTTSPLYWGPEDRLCISTSSSCRDAGSDLASNICYDNAEGTFCMDEISAFYVQFTDSGQVDIGCHYPRVNSTYYIGTDFPTIQSAIDYTIDGDIVHLGGAFGYYYENIDFKGKSITVKGYGYPTPPTIDGAGSGPVVTFSSGETSEAVLEGINLGGGNASNPFEG